MKQCYTKNPPVFLKFIGGNRDKNLGNNRKVLGGGGRRNCHYISCLLIISTCVFLLLQRGESEVGQVAVAYVIKNRCDKQVQILSFHEFLTGMRVLGTPF
jgi:hypothetical protein